MKKENTIKQVELLEKLISLDEFEEINYRKLMKVYKDINDKKNYQIAKKRLDEILIEIE